MEYKLIKNLLKYYNNILILPDNLESSNWIHLLNMYCDYNLKLFIKFLPDLDNTYYLSNNDLQEEEYDLSISQNKSYEEFIEEQKELIRAITVESTDVWKVLVNKYTTELVTDNNFYNEILNGFQNELKEDIFKGYSLRFITDFQSIYELYIKEYQDSKLQSIIDKFVSFNGLIQSYGQIEDTNNYLSRLYYYDFSNMNNLLNDFSTNDKFINDIFNLGDSIQKDVEMNLSRIFFSYKIFNTKKGQICIMD